LLGAQLQSIVISPSNQTISAGNSVQLSSFGHFSDTSVVDISSGSVWSSTLPSTASINSTGYVSGIYSGTTTIRSISGSVTGTTTITVVPTLSGILINSASSGSLQLVASATYIGGPPVNNPTVTWFVDNTSVATINSSSGLLTPLLGGNANASATQGVITSNVLSIVIPGPGYVDMMPSYIEVAQWNPGFGGFYSYTPYAAMWDGDTTTIAQSFVTNVGGNYHYIEVQDTEYYNALYCWCINNGPVDNSIATVQVCNGSSWTTVSSSDGTMNSGPSGSLTKTGRIAFIPPNPWVADTGSLYKTRLLFTPKLQTTIYEIHTQKSYVSASYSASIPTHITTMRIYLGSQIIDATSYTAGLTNGDLLGAVYAVDTGRASGGGYVEVEYTAPFDAAYFWIGGGGPNGPCHVDVNNGGVWSTVTSTDFTAIWTGTPPSAGTGTLVQTGRIAFKRPSPWTPDSGSIYKARFWTYDRSTYSLNEVHVETIV